jgi:hypothetical protein
VALEAARTPADSSRPDPSTGRARVGLAAWLLMTAALVYKIAFLAWLPARVLPSRTFDDACYYFKIARNVAAGLGTTFDGLHATNGFQPLWLWMITPLFALVHGGPETMFRLCLALQVVLLWVAGLRLDATLAELVPRPVRVLVSIAFVFLVFMPSVNGMETAVLVLSLVLLFELGWRTQVFGEGSVAGAWRFGLLLGLVMLARLDMMFMAIAIGIAMLSGRLRQGERTRTLLRLGAMALGASVIVMPYLLDNRIAFGAFVPISGLLKSSFPRITTYGTLLDRLGLRGILHVVVAIAIFVRAALLLRTRDRSPGERFLDGALATAALALLLHVSYSLLFMKWAIFRWHFLWYALFTTLALAIPARRWFAPRGMLVRAPLFTAVAVVLVLAGVTELYRQDFRDEGFDWRYASYEAALWARGHTPPDAIFAMHDSGIFSFFSERRVINLDGLVNTLAYQAALRDHRLTDYLARAGTRYVVKHNFGDVDYQDTVDIHRYERSGLRVRSRWYDVWSDPIWVRHADEVYRSREYSNGRVPIACVIWRWSGTGESGVAPR